MVTQAAPFDHDEVAHGYRLYEGLTRQDGSIRHGPSGTTWVHGFRGVSPRDEPAIVFRPGAWLRGGVHGAEILEDVGEHKLDAGADGGCLWAAVAAPPGVRLRAIVLELAARGRQLPAPIALDLVARTRDALVLGRDGDTFITWSGGLWLAPSFAASWDHEAPSIVGDEIYDALTLDSDLALSEVLTGRLASSALGLSPQGHELPPALTSFASGLRGEPFFASCAQRESAIVDRGELARIAHELFPDAYERQQRARRA